MSYSEKKFEVPYNFDFSLIDFYADHGSMISFIYLPPFKSDAINTRTIIENPNKGSLGYMPVTREEYTEHLMSVNQKGLKFRVLWQDNKNIEHETIRFYMDHGSAGFVVGSEKNASAIKKYDKNISLTASITMRLTSNDLLNRDFSNFDSIVLFFPFTRSLDAIKKLSHIKDKLILMPNTVCWTDCPAVHHWFPKNNELREEDRCLSRSNVDKCCFIYPGHLYLFDSYVAGYKLQGREYPTFEIIANAEAFFTRSSDTGFLEPFFDARLRSMLAEKGLSEFYSIKSDELINTGK